VLLLAGMLSAIQILVEEYAIFGVVGRATPLSGAVGAAWIESWIWLVGVTLITTITLLIFPTGALISPRWRAVAWLAGLDGTVGVVGLAFAGGPLNNAPFIDNPYPALGDLGKTLFFASYAGLAFVATASAASLLVRYRRVSGVERQQLKWLALEAGLIAITVAVTVVAQAYAPDFKPTQVLFIVVIALVPFTIGIAVLRYRLYDIDVLINRALVYGATTAGIAAAFFGGIVLLQALLRPITSGSELAVAASTLSSLALFQPLRRRIQDAVDRRFYRSRYDAGRILDDFSVRLRDQVAIDAVRADLLDAVRDTVQPAHASVWLREASSR
jgi:hypothetical protein